VVFPSEAWVTAQWEGGWMTFTTCNPKYSSRQRLIVFSKLVDGPNAGAIDTEYHPEYLPPLAPPGTTAEGWPVRPPTTAATTTTTSTTTTTEATTTTTTEASTTTTEDTTTTTTEDTTTTTEATGE